ncbi:MAG TPA: hypothetical protein VFK27_07110 [Bacillales bacterium]|nr:hypothetical protein [Bacillales bacterium]
MSAEIEAKVLRFIRANFEKGSVTIDNFPGLAAAKVITDREGSRMLVFWDYRHQCVDFASSSFRWIDGGREQ